MKTCCNVHCRSALNDSAHSKKSHVRHFLSISFDSFEEVVCFHFMDDVNV